jgi:signal transduction histidine kinase
MHWLPMVSAAAAALAVAGGAFGWPRRPAVLAAGAALVSLAHTAVFRGPGTNSVAYWLVAETGFMLFLLAHAVRRPSPRVSAAVGGLAFAAIALSPLRIGLWQEPPMPAHEIFAACGFWALLAAAAVGVGSYLRWTDRARAEAAAAARREQRMELARDMHDWLSHEMTAIVLEAQTAQLRAGDGTETGQSFRRIEEAGARGLEAMDRTLRLLREAGDATVNERLATVAEVGDVARRFAELTSARVEVSIDEGLDALRPEVVTTVHRIVMESLTNVRRHAATASSVGVQVKRDGSNLVVSVADDGADRRERRARSGGAGLVGLTERVEAIGGTLSAGRADTDGWTVRAVLPVVP